MPKGNTDASNTKKRILISKRLFTLPTFLLFALRFLHFGPELDAPHDWRQSDTAWYILDFFRNGIDLLHPAVCWMGASDTVVLEFPLPEAMVAMVWQLFGEFMPVAFCVSHALVCRKATGRDVCAAYRKLVPVRHHSVLALAGTRTPHQQCGARP